MSEPIARDTLEADLSAHERVGATVHSFAPDATPQEKAAAAGKARSQLASVTGKDPLTGATGAEAREISLDVGAGGAHAQPTVDQATIARINAEEAKSPKSSSELNGQPQVAKAAAATSSKVGAGAGAEDADGGGEVSAQPYRIPDDYRVGWRANVLALDENGQKKKNFVEQYVPEEYYGVWYHHGGIIFFAVLSTYFLTLFHFGWGWLIIVLATCATYYGVSVDRFQRATRDDINRELIKNRLATEHESADWINNFLDRFWLIYEPVLSATIVSSVDQVLSISAPPLVDSLRLSTFTLGTKAPRIERVRTYPRTSDEEVLMEWGLSFTSTDLSDLAPSQLAGKTNSKIVLEIKVGKGPARVTMPILVENIEFSGFMRIKLTLMTNFPHVKTVDMSFMEKPTFNYVLKPIGGETFGFDINVIPGLQSFIRDTVHSILGPMMYDPNVFTLNLEQLLSGTPLDTAVGVLHVHVVSARGLKNGKFGGGTPDPYVSISINNRAEIARTKAKKNTYNPHWESTHYLLLTDANLSEPLSLEVMDHNDRTKDSQLGVANFQLSELLQDATREGVVSKILKEGKDGGELVYNLSYYPVLKPKALEGGGIEPIPDTQVGIVRLTIHQAKELDVSKSMSKDINPFARIMIKDKIIHQTPTYKHTVQPVWESSKEQLITDKDQAVVTIAVLDDREIRRDPVVGYLGVRLTDLLKAKEQARDWFPLSGSKSGRVRISAEWKPLNMPGAVQGAAAYRPPIGVVRLWIKKASDVKNVEGTLGGKSDPYVRVMMKGVTLARTEVINNNLNPEWDQIIYAPAHALSDVLVLETMDYQHLGKDRSLGYVELPVKKLAKPSSADEKFLFESTGRVEAQEPIRLSGNTYKGKLHYVAEFVPAYNLKGISFEPTASAGAIGTSGGGEETEGEEEEDTILSDDASDHHNIPEGVTYRGSIDQSSKPVRRHTKGAKSTDTTASVDDKASIRTASTRRTTAELPPALPATVEKPEELGLDLPREELFKHQSGVLVVNAIEGSLSKKSSLQLLLDDGYWPSFATERSVSTHVVWDRVGEGFIKELDFSNVWLRLNEDEEGVKDEIIGEIRMTATSFLDECFGKVGVFELRNQRGEITGTVRLTAKYVPVPVVLEARESINNMGSLRVQVVSGSNLRAADRGGKSDPYAVFTLNGQKVFKTETKKKTLNPVWDQSFEALVLSRVAAKFEVEVFDWDQVGTADELGSASINLADLEPLEAIERVLPLNHPKHGQKGEIKIQLVFHPQIVAKARSRTTTLGAAGRAMTTVGAVPFGVVGGVAHGVGHGASFVGKGVAKGIFGVGKKPKTIDEEGGEGYSIAETLQVPQVPANGAVPPSAAGQASQPAPAGASTVPPEASVALGAAFPTVTNTAAMPTEGVSAPSQTGNLRVMVVSAKDLVGEGLKPYVEAKIGKKEHETKRSKGNSPEWNESFTFLVGPETKSMFVNVLDHKTLGKDRPLGEAEVDIWRHIQLNAASPITAADVFVELTNGSGLLQLRLDFEAGSASRAATMRTNASVEDINGGLRTPNSPSRFSISKRPPETPPK